jgi:hypothetical protein
MANTLKFGNGQWATGNGTALAYNDENANFKPLPFDFTRASSATVVNQSGLIETVGSGIPRIDFLGNTKGALKLEPSRTNLIVNSEDFEGSGWTDFNVTLTSGQSSPDGNSNAYLIEPTNSSFLLYAQSTVIASTEYKFSYFFKSGTKDAVKIAFYNDTANSFIETNATQSFVDYGNGWKKIITTVTTPSGCTSLYSYIDRSSEVGTFYAWGAQLEQGSYATSYIPTSGSAVTRVADACSQTPPSGVIGQTEGVLYAEISALTNNPPFSPICLSNNNTNNRILIYLQDTRIRVLCQFNNISFFAFNYTVSDVSNLHKIALKYKSGESALWVNGTYIAGSSTTTNGASSDMLIFRLGNSTGTVFFEGNCKDIRVYNTALTDAQLKALTT